jgi:formamidopyrimidine-DNA glycosylase
VPELPEVETVVRLLRAPLVGRRVTAVDVAWPRTVGGDPGAVARGVRGARVEAIRRRGKFLLFDLERPRGGRAALVGHLRMTGRMHVRPRGSAPDPFERVRLSLDDGGTFAFDDVRKFGRLVLVGDADEVVGGLGPEPLEPAFTAEWLAAALRARRRAMKPLLLDQTFVAGLGNIYVDEALFQAGIHPLTTSHRVPAAAAARLTESIRDILSRAIERRGTSFDGFYRTPEGRPGGYQDHLNVYDRAGEPCRRCGTKVRRLVVGQRGTHVCPRCQPRMRQRRASR